LPSFSDVAALFIDGGEAVLPVQLRLLEGQPSVLGY